MKLLRRIEKKLKSNYKTASIYNKIAILGKKRNFRKNYFNNEIDDKLVLFESFMGRKYACSPKAIYEYMLSDERFKDYKFVWAFKKPDDKKNNFFDERTTLIKYNRDKYFEVISKAKYWITNSRIPETIIKKDEQIYVQCWHGTPLKRLGYDIKVKGKNAESSNRRVRKQYRKDASRYTYMISPSSFCSEKFISAFNLKGLGKENIIIEKGYPRNDFLFNYKKEDIKRIKEKLNIPKNKKIILYAPTWRENQHELNKGYTYNLAIDFDNLKKQIGDEYVVLFRPHYFVANSFDFEKYKGFIFNVANHEDINELYIIADLLITDYSSVFFDYANLGRPMIFYMYDLEEYKNELRDFYIDLKELPGPITQNEKDLIKEIKNCEKNKEKYATKYKKFNKKFNYLDDGKSTSRVVDTIFFN